MLKKASLVSLAALAVACSNGEGGSEGSATTSPPIAIPPTSQSNTAPSVTTEEIRAQTGEAIDVGIATVDADGDPVTLTLVDGPDWVSLTSDGRLTGTPEVDAVGTYEIVVDANDGTDTTTATIEIRLFMDPVEQAFATGDFTYIAELEDTDLPSVLLREIETIRADNIAAISEIYRLDLDGTLRDDSLNALNWSQQPGTTYFYTPVFGQNMPLVAANPSQNLALIGSFEQTRYLVASGNALEGGFSSEPQHEIHSVWRNAIEWLLKGETTDVNVVIAQKLDDSSTSSIRTWLNGAFPNQLNINHPRECDGAGFSTCITDETDLIVLYQDIQSVQEADALVGQVQNALAAGIPVVSLQKATQNSALSQRLNSLLDVRRSGKNSGPAVLRFSNLSPLTYLHGWEPDIVPTVVSLVEGIESGSFNFDLSACAGPLWCEENEAFRTEVASPLRRIRSYLSELDSRKISAFGDVNQNRFFASLLLLGDYYRSLSTFPMPKADTPTNTLARALFGDYSAIIHRKYNPAMPDMGTYSRSAFEDGLLLSEAVSLTAALPFKTSGLYALPGETVTVTRTDDSGVVVHLRVQSLSEESGAPFRTIDGDEYQRPSLISSNKLQIGFDETLSFTSPFGGPIHVYFNSDDGSEIELEFENVAQHPVWRTDEETEAFLIDLAANRFDWAEFVRPNFEVHATAENMREMVENRDYSGPSDIGAKIDTYLRGWQYWLDGQTGPGIFDNPDREAFDDQRQLQVVAKDNTVMHVNSDRAPCRDSCDANPYDTARAFDPLSNEDQDTLSRKLNSSVFRFGGANSGSIIGLYTLHSQFRFFEETGALHSACRGLPHEDLYSTVQAGHANGDPVEFITNEVLGVEQHNAMYVQLMAALENQGALEDGWTLFSRYNAIMHQDAAIIYRNYVWPGRTQTAFCFNGISQLEARQLPRNDWLLVTLSCATQRDLSAYLEMWGFAFRESIKAHVANRGFETLRPAYYAIPEKGHCTGLNHPEIPVDGTSTWP